MRLAGPFLTRWSVILVVLFVAIPATVAAFLDQVVCGHNALVQSTTTRFRLLPRNRHSSSNWKLLLAEKSDSIAIPTDNDQQVIASFESWFSSTPQAAADASIQHTFFGKLRGLTWTSGTDAIPSTPVVSVPLSIVLQSGLPQSSSLTTRPEENNNDWDATLARQLWSECRQGEQSKLSGYCTFLMQGKAIVDAEAPPSTAPNALRHWTKEERASLQQTAAGQKLLTLELEQQELWKNKYSKLEAMNAAAGNDMSWEQFQWAMEVVHSRAFRGNFGSNADADSSIVSKLLPTIIPPLAAALAGWIYAQSNPYPDDLVLGILAIVAVIPLGLNLLRSSSTPPTAVLLPMIDSANHDEDADSSIEFDPLTNCFQMSIGPKCLLSSPIPDSKDIQLCVSYGKRSDPELLLNYGFLPGEPCSDDAPPATQRARLAEAFNRRN